MSEHKKLLDVKLILTHEDGSEKEFAAYVYLESNQYHVGLRNDESEEKFEALMEILYSIDYSENPVEVKREKVTVDVSLEVDLDALIISKRNFERLKAA